MRKRRRIDMWFSYAAASFFLALYMLLLLMFALSSSTYSLETQILVVGTWAMTFGFYIWGVHYVFIKSSKDPLRYGVTLTENTLNVLGREIPVSAITRAELAWFASSRTVLAVDFKVDRKRRMEIATHFLWPSNTENISELCDRVRELKGWPKQLKKPVYSWGQWKSTRAFPYGGSPIWFPRSIHFEKDGVSERIAFGVIVGGIEWKDIAAVKIFRLPRAPLSSRSHHVARFYLVGVHHGSALTTLRDMSLSEKKAAELRKNLLERMILVKEVSMSAGAGVAAPELRLAE